MRAESTAAPLVVSGNGDGLVAASAVGLLAGNPTIFYTGTLDTETALRKRVLAAKPTLVVTDTNPKQAYRWNGITENAGYIETAKSPHDAVDDPLNAPLEPVPRCPGRTPSAPPSSTASSRSRPRATGRPSST